MALTFGTNPPAGAAEVLSKNLASMIASTSTNVADDAGFVATSTPHLSQVASLATTPPPSATTFSLPQLLAGANDLLISAPHQIFIADVQEAAAGKVLQDAVSSGWRYLLLRGGAAVAEAEVESTGQTPPSFRSFTQGAYAQATVEALSKAETRAELAGGNFEGGNFEVRYLRVFGLSIAALWFHNAAAPQDFVMPLAPVAGLTEMTLYPADRFVASAREAARRWTAADARP